MPDSSSITLDSVRVLFEKGTYFGNDSFRGLSEADSLLLPYSMQQDLVVTALMLLAFLLLCYALSRGRMFMLHQLKGFFSERSRDNLFAETSNKFRYQTFLVVQTIFMLGVLLYDLHLRQIFPPPLFPSWQVLGGSILGVLAYYVLKFMLYGFVNWVFFAPVKCDRWFEILFLVISLQGVCLFVLACLSIYGSLNAEIVFYTAGFVILLSKILLFYKTKSIFFTNFRGLCYNILYLCTLEMTPLVILWKIIRDISGIS